MAGFLGAQNIVHIEDIVAVFVVVAVVLDTLARLGKNPAWVARRLIFEIGVAYPVGCREMDRERLKGLERKGLVRFDRGRNAG